MKKITIYHYHGESKSIEEKCGYKHLSEMDAVSVHETAGIAGKIFDTGLNVMLYHIGDDGIVIFIDTKNFRQR